MVLSFEEVRFDMIGRGGTDEDIPLIDEVDGEIQRCAQLLSDNNIVDNATATISIKITLKAMDGNSVAVIPDLTIKEPKRNRRGLSAFLDDNGDLITAEHRQQALPLSEVIEDNFVPILPEKKGA